MDRPQIDVEDAEALDAAAERAVAEGDAVHAKQLRERAVRARRIQREKDAGIRNIPWHFPESWCR